MVVIDVTASGTIFPPSGSGGRMLTFTTSYAFQSGKDYYIVFDLGKFCIVWQYYILLQIKLNVHYKSLYSTHVIMSRSILMSNSVDLKTKCVGVLIVQVLQ